MGQKFAGEESSPPLKISFIFASHHDSGTICLSRRIFEMRVSRKWWWMASFWDDGMWSYHLQVKNWMTFSWALFILPGVIAKRSKGVIFCGSGDGITLSIPMGEAWIPRGVILGVRTLGDSFKVGVSFRCAKAGLNISTQALTGPFFQNSTDFLKCPLLTSQIIAWTYDRFALRQLYIYIYIYMILKGKGIYYHHIVSLLFIIILQRERERERKEGKKEVCIYIHLWISLSLSIYIYKCENLSA